MPLRIKLPTKERIIINGAVIENAGEATTLVLLNAADVLRRKEVLQERDAITPARRVYYALQCAYAFFQERDQFLESFRKLLAEYEEAAPRVKSEKCWINRLGLHRLRALPSGRSGPHIRDRAPV